ncbi:hypothetical protein MKW94_015508 [Papaver nudicaule]|uniref:Uncharacterized protein n=1 Tax=Papaver nudicaule TaxID=74823 RepID=A0AA41V9E2_PAPNU|nr:hypothetical protein [Papaver nudicaule]
MEDSFQPPVPDAAAADKYDEQKLMEEGYASSISCDYSDEEEYASDSESYINALENCPPPELIDGKFMGEISLEHLSDGEDEWSSPFYIEKLKPKSCSQALKYISDTDVLQVADWKMSWPKGCKLVESGFVNVYSYFQEHTGVGGYAVVLRNMSGEPIAASAKFSLDGNFYMFQVLDGLLAGLQLASKYGCSNPYLRCNSRAIVSELGGKYSPSCDCNGQKIGPLCLTCVRFYGPSIDKDCFKALMPLLEELHSKKLDALNFDSVSSRMNKAARFLAKYVKDKAMLDRKALVDMRNRRMVGYKVEIEPSEFPDALGSILLDDAFDSLYYNLDARAKFEENWHRPAVA